MKKLKYYGMSFLLISLTVFFTGCYSSKNALDGMFTPNCKQFGVGSVCFHNPSGKTIKVELPDYKIEVLAFSTLCFDLYEGEYEYKVKKSGDKWKEELNIVRCKEEKIELSKCDYC